jgi:type IV pilus assembly protein PilN
MIRINLLPFRKARKIENVQRQVTIFSIILVVIMAGMLYYNTVLKNKIEKLDAKVADIKTQITRVEKRAKKVDQLKKALANLNKKIEVIKDLETKRQEAVRLLENMTEMVTEKPDLSADTLEDKDQKPYKRLWFTGFQAQGDSINIQGVAIDNKTVADFMTRLEASKLYSNVNLKTLKQTKIKKLNLKSFQISCNKSPKPKDKKDKKSKK